MLGMQHQAILSRSQYRQHIVTLFVLDIVLFLYVEFSEEIESYNRVDVHNYG
jgi:hypothetical protein